MKRVRAAAYTPAVHDVANFLGQQTEHWRGDVGEEARDEGAEVLVIGCKVNQQLLLPRRRFSRCLRRHPGHHAPYLQHASGGAKARERGAARGARRHALCPSNPALWGYHLTHNTQHTTHNTQHTTHNTQHTTHNTQHTTHNTQHTTHNTQHTTHSTQHTAHNTHHTTQHTTQHLTPHTTPA